MKKRYSAVSLVLLLTLVVVGVVGAQSASSVPGGGWWSGEMIQNISDATASIVVTAYDANGTNTYEVSDSLSSGEAKNFIPSDFTGMPSGFEGSAIVNADQAIKAVVNVTNRQAGDFGVAGGQAAAQYQGIDGSAVADTLYFPMAKNDRYGKTTSFYIQNADSSAATADCVFTMDDGTVYNYTTPSIGPGQMVVVVPDDAGVPSTNTSRQNIGSLTVSSTANLAGVVMEYNTSESPATLLQSTRGFTSNDFDTVLYAPTVKQNRYNRFTGIQVQNVEPSASVNVTVTLVGSRGACVGSTYVRTYENLAAGASKTFNQIAGQDGAMVDDCAASATIEATGNIVAVVSESFLSGQIPSGQNQASTTYSAFPQSLTSTKISVPMYKENRYNKYTGLVIQNVSDTNADNVVLTFIGAAGNAAGNTYTTVPLDIAAGSSIELSRVSDDAALWSGTTVPSNSTYGITIVADQNVVAIANEAVFPGASLNQDKNNYEGFNLTP
jgi:hypothetical protein